MNSRTNSKKLSSNKKRAYGWVPDMPDHRDYQYKAIRPKLKLPTHVDLRKECSAIEDQGALGSCTANALSGNLEFLDNRIDQEYVEVSRLFIYYNERVLMNTEDYDSGATLRDGIKTLVHEGACSEEVWPYKIEQFDQEPSAKCYAEAAQHRIVSYHRLQTINDMLTCLAEGFPFVFGFTVYESFQSPESARTGVIAMPDTSESVLGGHAVMAVGFDQKSQRFIIRNSWGKGWGQQGYCTMPFEYLEYLAQDFWTIRK